MTKIRFILCTILALLLSLLPLCAGAQIQFDYQEMIDELLGAALNGLNQQQWLDGPICDAAGGSMDNYVIYLNSRPNSLDFSGYIEAASVLLKDEAISNPVSRMRCALALVSCGAADRIPDGFADSCIGKLGVMSYVYGLHLLNNGIKSDLWTAESLTEKLLSMQKADGGWSVMGNFSDVDVTAMCLQALACVDHSVDVFNAIERAVVFLGENQLESGGYKSNGYENLESAAQVIIACTSLGIDAASDERFIKNGRSVVDALLEYRLPDGEFAHLPDDTTANEKASMQALQALAALEQRGIPYLKINPGNAGALRADASGTGLGWKLWAFIAIAVFMLAGIVFSLTRRHGKFKQLLFVIILSALLAYVVLSLDVQSADDYYNPEAVFSKGAAGEVYVSIRCDAVAGRADDGSTPEDGVILERTAMPIQDGYSVFDVLTDAARKYELHMEHEGGSGDMAYINGINHLYEYTYGELSGWVYEVNGARPSVGCGSCKLQSGDEIVWRYTTSLGEDLK